MTTLGAEFHATYLKLPARLSIQDFGRKCRTVGQMVKSNPWWAASLVEQGEAIFGESAWQYLDELGYAERTLLTIARVGRQIPKERRRSGLSFEIHRLVAPLEPDQQDKWLLKAEQDKLSRAKLRKALQEAGLVATRVRAGGKTDDLWARVRRALDLLKAARDRMERAWSPEEVEGLVGALEAVLGKGEAPR